MVTRSGEVAFEDVWLFGYRDPGASRYFTRIAMRPLTNTTAPAQVATPHPARVMLAAGSICVQSRRGTPLCSSSACQPRSVATVSLRPASHSGMVACVYEPLLF